MAIFQCRESMRNFFVSFCLFLLFWSPVTAAGPDIRPEDIQTILPKDGIQAILKPSFESVREAPWLAGSDSVVGVAINGDARAYPVPILSDREIVNDTVGGVPIAVTW